MALIVPIGAADPVGETIRLVLDERTFDPREPAMGDFLDCPDARGPCQAVALPRVMADEKVILPRNKPLESLRFLSLKGIRAQGGDPMLSIALFATPKGDSVFADLNDDEDLGNDGPGKFWPKGDSCVTLAHSGAGMPPLALCRAGKNAKAWREKCEGLKRNLAWAMCDEEPIRIRVMDINAGWLQSGGKHWWLGACDADGDGRIRLDGGDRVVVDWDGEGALVKSLDAGGVAAAPGAPIRFSLDSISYQVVAADDKGGWLDLKRLAAFDPAAAAPKAFEGRPAPDLRFVNMDGDTVRLSDLRGKKVLLHFWSTLCKPCYDNLEGVRGFWKSFGGKNWQVISITTESDLPSVQQAVLKHHMDWMVGMAGPEARRFYANHPLPMLVKINEKGVVENKNLELGPHAR
ncbi:MAG: TlpA family protein disulfide reductase [Fibrobacteres bacterium]|nr:TlpA family protein disulfide reductase [Fibrobacterota bacterium]